MDFRKILLLMLILSSMTGCNLLEKAMDTFTKNEVTPVMPEAPPRGRAAIAEKTDNSSRNSIVSAVQTIEVDSEPSWKSTGVKPASYETSRWYEQLADSQVVARVNSEPILAGEILERYAPKLREVRSQATPEQIAEIRKSIIQRDIQLHIESKLLVSSLRQSIPKKNLKLLDDHIEGLFNKELERLKKELKVQSHRELVEKLAEQGTSLETLRDAFANQRMAVEYLAAKSKPTEKVSRQDLLSFYEEHRKDYTKPARVKWQEIKIPFAKHGGKEKTRILVSTILSELSRNASFSDLAKKHSDGATSTAGGHWGWIQKGSLANTKLEKEMFTLPLPELEEHLVENESNFQIVRVVDREDSFLTPFQEVQEEIRKKLTLQSRKEMAKKVVEDLKKNADIWTIFDTPDTAEVPANEDTFFSPVGEH